MVEVIPVINVSTWEEARKRIESIELYTDWIEIDISDNTFASTKTWANPVDLKNLQDSKHLRFAVHLMVKEPEKIIDSWIKAGVRRIIVHYEVLAEEKSFKLMLRGKKGEAQKRIEALSKQCRENWVEFGLSIVWKTDPGVIRPYLGLVDLVHILAVDPGPSGQAFHPEALKSAEFLRSLQSSFKFKIEWDGGVNLTNIREIKNAGADIIVVGNAIFGASNPSEALEMLKREVL